MNVAVADIACRCGGLAVEGDDTDSALNLDMFIRPSRYEFEFIELNRLGKVSKLHGEQFTLSSRWYWQGGFGCVDLFHSFASLCFSSFPRPVSVQRCIQGQLSCSSVKDIHLTHDYRSATSSTISSMP